MREQIAHHSPPRKRTSSSSPSTVASAHSVGTNAGMHPVDASYTTVDQDDEYDDAWPPRLNSSARRYNQPRADVRTEEQPTRGKSVVPPRSKAMQRLPLGVVLVQGVPCINIDGQWVEVVLHHNQQPPAKRHLPQRQTEERVPLRDDEHLQRNIMQLPRFHWLFWVGLALCLMWVGYVVLTLVGNWVQVRYNDAVYGRPRTYQTDAVVGHADSTTNPSHFQCLNLDKRIQVIEFPGGDSSKAKVYEGPTLVGPGQELTPCTLSFRDVNGDGKPDMILSIGGTIFVMLNDETGFRPPRPGEHINL